MRKEDVHQAASQKGTGGDPQPASSAVDKRHGVDASFGDTRGTNTSAAPNMGSQITGGNDTGKTGVKGRPASDPVASKGDSGSSVGQVGGSASSVASAPGKSS